MTNLPSAGNSHVSRSPFPRLPPRTSRSLATNLPSQRAKSTQMPVPRMREEDKMDAEEEERLQPRRLRAKPQRRVKLRRTHLPLPPLVSQRRKVAREEEVAAETVEEKTAEEASLTRLLAPLTKILQLQDKLREVRVADQETRTTTEVVVKTKVETVEATVVVAMDRDVVEAIEAQEELLLLAVPLGPVETTSRHPSEEVGWSENLI